MKVKEFMSATPITVNSHNTVLEAAQLMIKKNISILPVVNDANELVGIITESDFIGRSKDIPHALVSIKEVLGESFNNRDIESVYKAAQNKKVEEVMTTNKLVTVTPEHDMTEVVDHMIKSHLKRIPVIDSDGVLVGIVTRRNILKCFTEL